MKLSVSEYNKLEKLQFSKFSNRVLQAFIPTTFTKLGYPIEVTNSNELWRYCDVMQEGRVNGNLDFLGGMSEEEFDACVAVSEQVQNYSESIGHKTTGKHAITRAIISKRILDRLVSSNIRVLEIGPGSACFGAMLVNSGHSYFSTDITQAFYLHQNSFFYHAFKDEFSEWAIDPTTVKKNNHIPWWNIANNNFELPDIDVVFCNHVLTEMHPNSFRFTLKRVIESMRRCIDSNDKYIIAEGLYDTNNLKVYQVISFLYGEGLNLIYWKDGMAVFQIEELHTHDTYKNLAKKNAVYLYSLMPKAMRLYSKKIFYYVSVKINRNTKKTITKKVGNKLIGNLGLPSGKVVSTEKIMSYFNSIIENEKTEDEKFIDYIVECFWDEI